MSDSCQPPRGRSIMLREMFLSESLLAMGIVILSQAESIAEPFWDYAIALLLLFVTAWAGLSLICVSALIPLERLFFRRPTPVGWLFLPGTCIAILASCLLIYVLTTM